MEELEVQVVFLTILLLTPQPLVSVGFPLEQWWQHRCTWLSQNRYDVNIRVNNTIHHASSIIILLLYFRSLVLLHLQELHTWQGALTWMGAPQWRTSIRRPWPWLRRASLTLWRTWARTRSTSSLELWTQLCLQVWRYKSQWIWWPGIAKLAHLIKLFTVKSASCIRGSLEIIFYYYCWWPIIDHFATPKSTCPVY